MTEYSLPFIVAKNYQNVERIRNFCFQKEPVSHLTTPGILNKHGMDKTLHRDKHLRSPHFVRNQSRSSCRADSVSIRADLDSGTVRRPRSSSLSRNTRDTVQTPADTFRPMWSWYYGESGQPANSISVPGMQSLNFISVLREWRGCNVSTYVTTLTMFNYSCSINLPGMQSLNYIFAFKENKDSVIAVTLALKRDHAQLFSQC